MRREDWTPRWYRGEANLRGDAKLWRSPFQVAKLRTTVELQN